MYSVAWDWVFTGVTPVAVENEMMAALECAAHNKHAKVSSRAARQADGSMVYSGWFVGGFAWGDGAVCDEHDKGRSWTVQGT